jgi:hypothetical protein
VIYPSVDLRKFAGKRGINLNGGLTVEYADPSVTSINDYKKMGLFDISTPPSIQEIVMD